MEHECDCTLWEEHLDRCPGAVVPAMPEGPAILGPGLRRRGPAAKETKKREAAKRVGIADTLAPVAA